jgi:hypothetical protein
MNAIFIRIVDELNTKFGAFAVCFLDGVVMYKL